MSPAKTASKTSTKTSAAAPQTATKSKTLAGKVNPAHDAGRAEVLKQYETAVRAMQSGNYTAAHPALEALLKTAPTEFVDRIRMYLAACIAQSSKKTEQFASPEERYDYAISLLNDGQYDDARQHLDEILAGDTNADYAFYGLALLASMTGDTQSCLDKLTEAIRLNNQNRFLARSDSDFQDMNDDPRFTELLYPEAQ